MNDLTNNKKKPLDISILNSIIENTIKSNAISGLNKDHYQQKQNNSFRDFTKSYRNHNINLNNINRTNENRSSSINRTEKQQQQQYQSIQPPRFNLDQNEITVNNTNNKKQKFKFKMKFLRSSASIKDFIPCICLWFLLLGITAIYFGLVWPRLIEIFNFNSYWIIFLVFKCFFLFNLVVNFLLSIFKDPGRLPNTNGQQNSNDKSDLTVFVKGEPVELKWCTTCKFYRPPRCSHCRRCDSCVEDFDHHCEFINNCVGKRNYINFFLTLFNSIIYMFLLLACCLIVIINAIHIQTAPVIISIVLIIFLIILIILIGFLFMFHLYLIGSKQSTNEYSKRKKISSLNDGICLNFLLVYCKPNQPAYLSYNIKRPKSFESNQKLSRDHENIAQHNQIKNKIDVSHIPIKTLANFSNIYGYNNNSYICADTKQHTTIPIGIENLYIEAPTKSTSSVKKALNLASKTANVSSF